MLPAETKPIRGSTTFIAISDTFDKRKSQVSSLFLCIIAPVFAKFFAKMAVRVGESDIRHQTRRYIAFCIAKYKIVVSCIEY